MKVFDERRLLVALALALSALACGGAYPPADGPGDGDVGAFGDRGDLGEDAASDGGADVGPGCGDVGEGEVLPLRLTLESSQPANGKFFIEGERPRLRVGLVDERCGARLPLETLAEARLYAVGPRPALGACAADWLLNAKGGEGGHFVDLLRPEQSAADTSLPLPVMGADGLLRLELAPPDVERPGSYSVGVLAREVGVAGERLLTAHLPLQLAMPGAERFPNESATGSTCAACHVGPDFLHASPGVPSIIVGVPLERADFATCALCHVAEGASRYPTLLFVHGAHRGSNLIRAGAARPELGLSEAPWMARYGPAGEALHFPHSPGGERACARCHAQERYLSRPSRLACGSCHDGTDFSSEAPLRHRKSDDGACAACHGSAQVRAAHEVLEETRALRHRAVEVALFAERAEELVSPAAVSAGEALLLRFKLIDGEGRYLSGLEQEPDWSFALLGAGPMERVPLPLFGPGPIEGLSITALSAGGEYEVRLPPIPEEAPDLAPGTYALVGSLRYRHPAVSPLAGMLESAPVNALFYFEPKASGGEVPRPLHERRRVLESACGVCHGRIEAHGGAWRGVASCVACHTAQDAEGRPLLAPLLHKAHSARGPRGNCALCHADGEGAHEALGRPSADACLSCHETPSARAHAEGAPEGGCMVCHAPGERLGADAVHPIMERAGGADALLP